MKQVINNEPLKENFILRFFRIFVLVYFCFYMFPYPFRYIPIIGDVLAYYETVINGLTFSIGHKLNSLDETSPMFNGSGDTTFGYVKLLTTILISLPISVALCVLISKRVHYHGFIKAVRIYVRYYLAYYLISYGFSKVFGLQFGSLDAILLDQKYGDSSPMALLWTFMGYSRAYSIFGGIAEILGGLLLFFRRTSVFGAMFSFGVMANVTMLNYTYDVPVKIFSTHLMLLSLLVFLPYIAGIFTFFFMDKMTKLHYEKLEFRKKWLRQGRVVLKPLVIVVLIFFSFVPNLKYRTVPAKHKLNGTYSPMEFITNNDTIIGQQKENMPWQKFYITNQMAKIVFLDQRESYFSLQIDTLEHTLRLTPMVEEAEAYQFDYDFVDDDVFKISGRMESNNISVRFKAKKLQNYKLLKRGYHWINETPYN